MACRFEKTQNNGQVQKFIPQQWLIVCSFVICLYRIWSQIVTDNVLCQYQIEIPVWFSDNHGQICHRILHLSIKIMIGRVRPKKKDCLLVLDRPTRVLSPDREKFLKSFPDWPTDRPTGISPDRKCFLKSKKFLKSFPDRPTDRPTDRPRFRPTLTCFLKSDKVFKKISRPTDRPSFRQTEMFF